MKLVLTLLFIFSFQLIFKLSQAQNVGIGTATPNNSAILDIQSSNKGVVFPSLTTAQRNAIVNPPDGLHVYNKDQHCLNNYDSLFNTWNCYCEYDTCKVILVRVLQNTGNIDFNSVYASKFPQSRNFALLIEPGVIVSSGINFATLSTTGVVPFKIKIINRGNIFGSGGQGGNGANGSSGGPCFIAATNGTAGTYAIETYGTIVQLTIDNYGIIGGGGGGGGGGGRAVQGQLGGGGGGGAGGAGFNGGVGGGTTSLILSTCVAVSGANIAQNGAAGINAVAGAGGAGANGGAAGGTGGGLGQSGLAGLGTSAGNGGAPGKAVYVFNGALGTTIINNYGGQVFGIVD